MSTSIRTNAVLAAALLSLGLGSAFAQTTGSSTGGGTGNTGSAGAGTNATSAPTAGSKGPKSSEKGSLPAAERKFIEEAARHGMAEVELGQMAQQKGMNQQVKDFGARMAQDHGKANDELKSLAGSKGVAVPAEVDKEHRKKADKLNRMAAEKFDREYMEDMVKDHKKDVKEFEKQAKNAKDADVRNFAAKTLPTLQEHLKLAQATRDAVKHAKK